MSPSTDPSIETSTCTSLPLCFSRVNPSTDSIADRCIRRWSAGTTLGRMDGEPVAPFPGLGCYRGPEAAGRAVARYRRSGPGLLVVALLAALVAGAPTGAGPSAHSRGVWNGSRRAWLRSAAASWRGSRSKGTTKSRSLRERSTARQRRSNDWSVPNGKFWRGFPRARFTPSPHSHGPEKEDNPSGGLSSPSGRSRVVGA